MTAYYPARGGAERIIGSAPGAAGHIHPGYVQHFLGDVQPPNPRGGDMWTRGGSVEFAYTDLSFGGQPLDDFFLFEDPGGITTMRFVLPDGGADVQDLVVTLSYAVADRSYGHGIPVLELVFQSGSTLVIPLDGATTELASTTVSVPAPADWLALAENEAFLDVDYAAVPDEIAIYDLSLTLLRTGFVYSFDGAQWVLMSTGGNVIESHNELIGREAINSHPIGAVTGLQNALDGKADFTDIKAGVGISVTPGTGDLTIANTRATHSSLPDLGTDDHPHYLDAARGYTRTLADQTFVNVSGDAMTGDLDVAARVRTNDLVVRSADTSHSAIEFADNVGNRRGELSAGANQFDFRSIDGSVLATIRPMRATFHGMVNVVPPGVSNELSITAGEGPPTGAVIVDGFGLYVDVTGASGPLYFTDIPGDSSSWSQLGGSGTHDHSGLYVALADHGSSDHSGLIATLAPKTHLTTAEGGTAAGDLLHVQYPANPPADLGLSAAIGVSATVARADHVHKRPTLAELNAAAAAHTHGATEIASGTLAFARLPTGTTSSTVAVGDHTHAYVPTTRVVTAGAGLAGGGALSADRTLDIGAGTGITVLADSVEINRAAVDAWYEPAGAASSAAASALGTHTASADPHVQYQLLAARGAASGYAPLGADGLVPNAHLPAVRTANYFSAADTTARKTLSTYDPTGLYRGDNVIVASPAGTWVYVGATSPADATSVAADASWTQLASGGVQSVNGLTGTVVLGASNVGAPPTTRTVTAGAGLTGGGDLSANRTFDIGAGTGITVAADSISVNRTTVDAWYSSPAQVSSAISTHAASSEHDGRYYTESEVDVLLSTKSPSSHAHDSDYVNVSGDTMTGALRVSGLLSSDQTARVGSDPADFTSLPGLIWIREDDATGHADPVFDPANYAALNHIHAGVYSPVGHSHAGDWAQIGHTHSQYATDGHAHSGYVSATGGTITGDLDVTGMLSVSGFVRTTDPPVLKPGQLWVDESATGAVAGIPVTHDHGYDQKFRWGTVTGTNPLQVRLDGDASPLPSAPTTLVGSLAVDDRVWVQEHQSNTLVLGKGPDLGVPLLELRGTGTQSIATSAFTVMTFWNDITPAGLNGWVSQMWSASNPGAVTIPRTGLYELKATIDFPSQTTGHRVFRWTLNGADFLPEAAASAYASAGFNVVVSKSVVKAFTKGDVVRLEGWQNSGANMAVNGYSNGWHYSHWTVRGLNTSSVDSTHVTIEYPFAPDLAWQTMSLLNGWVVYDATFTPPRYRKHANGVVEIQGLVKSGTAAAITTLPTGYRPSHIVILPGTCYPNAFARLNIQPDGVLRAESGYYNNTWVAINCQYYADQ
jgi:hypothetical protein